MSDETPDLMGNLRESLGIPRQDLPPLSPEERARMVDDRWPLYRYDVRRLMAQYDAERERAEALRAALERHDRFGFRDIARAALAADDQRRS